MNPVKALMLGTIRLYQLTLSCSNYAIEAIKLHGAVKGGWLMLMRLARCHPLGGRGYDPVPKTFRWCCWCRDCSETSSVTRNARRIFKL